VARLSLHCDVPIIPVGIVGTRAVQPPGSNLMRPFHSVTVRFGPPVTYLREGTVLTTGQCGGPNPDCDKDELRDLTDSLMTEISRLSGQEYVDLYANRARVS